MSLIHIVYATTNGPPKQALSEWKELIAGALASIVEILVTQPFEVIKTRAQVRTKIINTLTLID